MTFEGRLPNMRLKLAAVIALREAECLRPGGRELSFNVTARGGRVARSLSAIRWADPTN